jgi:hypothetical protein
VLALGLVILAYLFLPIGVVVAMSVQGAGGQERRLHPGQLQVHARELVASVQDGQHLLVGVDESADRSCSPRSSATFIGTMIAFAFGAAQVRRQGTGQSADLPADGYA